MTNPVITFTMPENPDLKIKLELTAQAVIMKVLGPDNEIIDELKSKTLTKRTPPPRK